MRAKNSVFMNVVEEWHDNKVMYLLTHDQICRTGRKQRFYFAEEVEAILVECEKKLRIRSQNKNNNNDNINTFFYPPIDLYRLSKRKQYFTTFTEKISQVEEATHLLMLLTFTF